MKEIPKLGIDQPACLSKLRIIFPRQILMEGPLQLLDSGKAVEMFVILFDDMLLITRRKKALSKKVTGFYQSVKKNGKR